MVFSEARSVGVSAVVEVGRSVSEGGERESSGGVGQKGGSGAGRNKRPGMRAGRTKVATQHNRGTYHSAPVAAVLIWNINTQY